MFVDHDAAVFGFQAGVVCERDVRPHACRADDEVGLDALTAVKGDTGVVDGGHGLRSEEANTAAGQQLCHALADVVAEPALQWHGFGSHHGGGHAELGETGGGLATDQAAADDDGRVGIAGRHLEDDGVGERAQGQSGFATGNGQRHRAGTAGQHQMPVPVAPPACGDDLLVRHVDVLDGDAAEQLDIVTDEPAGAVQVEFDLAAAQEVLAERRLGVGQGGVGGQDSHGDVRVLASERLRRTQPCRPTADGDET